MGLSSGCFSAPNQLGTSKLTPPSLPEGVEAVGEISGQWFGIHTRIDLRGCRDAATAWSLYLAGVPFFYPQARRIIFEGKARKRRRKLVSLFPGYLFAAGEEAEKHCREHPELVECLMATPRQERMVRDLTMIQTALAINPALDVSGIVVGRRVKVKQHHRLRGTEGVVQEMLPGPHGTRVHFEVPMLGRTVVLDLDESDLELLD